MIDFLLKKEEIQKLAEKYNLSLVALFGSQATGIIHSKSDIDIAVVGSKESDMFELVGDFYHLFEREDVEVVDLSRASPTLMYVVVRDGKVLYEKKQDGFFIWKLYAMKVWRETAWLRRLRDKKLIEWAKSF